MTTTEEKTHTKQQIHSKMVQKLKDLLVDGLKDIYWAEKNLAKALVKISKNATSEELKSAFDLHTSQTEQHVATVEQVFEIIRQKAQAKKCAAMEGLD